MLTMESKPRPDTDILTKVAEESVAWVPLVRKQ
jgi:hypothetical protein